MGCCHVRKFCYKSEQPAVGCYKPLVSREALTGWGASNSGLSSCSDLATNRSWILSQFLDEQLLKTSLKVLIGFWVIDGTSSPKRGESEPVHYLSCPQDYKPATGRLDVHVSPANETCDTDKSVCSFNDEYAGQPWRWADLCAPPLQA